MNAQDLLKIAKQAAEQRGTREGNDLTRMFQMAFRLSENENYDFHTNGEFNVMKRLAGCGIKTVFDVGANFGEWTRAILKIFPEAHTYCFEPIPDTFTKLVAALQEEPRATLHNIALADRSGELTFHYYRDYPGQTSMFEYPVNAPLEYRTCPAKTLDEVAEDLNVANIDILKIDVEGAEHMVLAGAEKLFVNRSIRIIQFEYGQININTRFLLQDFYTFFKGAGFRVGKIFPNTVDFSDYSLAMENFIGPNFIAVTTAEPELIRALS